MKIHSLYSSSSGNATRVVSDSGNVDLLIDAGVSWKKIQQKTSYDYIPTAIIITHEHTDHISGAGVAGRKTHKPVYILEKCYEEKGDSFFKGCIIEHFKAGDVLDFGDLKIRTFSVRHDCKDIVNMVIEEPSSGKKLGFLTDTGIITTFIKNNILGCDAYCIEMDYDTEKLASHDEYDPFLKERIKSAWGHLSNQQSIEFIYDNVDLAKVNFIMPLHLSDNTNSPELLTKQLEDKFGKPRMEKFILAPTKDFVIL